MANTNSSLEQNILDELTTSLKGKEIDASDLSLMAKRISQLTQTTDELKARLDVYYDYEKKHLDILKDYKEELKFVQSIQEDLRKERSKFFSENLKEVASSLKETGVKPEVQCTWIEELVASYTHSLNLSEDVVKESTINSLYEIQNKKEDIVDQIKSND